MITIKTNKVAAGGIMSALCLAILLGASFLPGKIALLFMASLVMGVCILRYKGFVAFSSYFAISVLSILLLPNKLVAWVFAILFGIYPLIKLYIERISNITIEYVVKFFVWNVHIFMLYIVLSVYGQNAIYNIAKFWIWACAVFLMFVYDLAYGIVINSFYRTYSKYL